MNSQFIMLFSSGIVSLILHVFADKSQYASESESNESSEECDITGRESLNYLSSKRPYFYNSKNAAKTPYFPKGCTPAKLWYFGRHGTRNPSKSQIKSIHTLLLPLHQAAQAAMENGKGKLCSDARNSFVNWKINPNLSSSGAKLLVEQGVEEMFQIGARFRERFSILFEAPLDSSSYLFKHTDCQRTEASARAFAKGAGLGNIVMPPAEKNDPVLQFYSACPKYIKEIKRNPAADAEHDKFSKSKYMDMVRKRAGNRMGLKTLTLDEVTIAYTTCGYESARANGTTSPWCQVFGDKDLEVMAYREDLRYFWMDGYGSKTNYKDACAPFKDALDFFESTSPRRIQAYFSHSGATLKMLARLGLFESKTLMTAKDFDYIHDDYQWKSSEIDTFATNMALALLDCDNKPDQIGFYFQEIPTNFPACEDEAFCSFDVFKRNVASFVNNCNLTKICTVTSGTPTNERPTDWSFIKRINVILQLSAVSAVSIQRFLLL